MGVDPTLDADTSIAELFWGTQGSIGEPFIRHYFHLETIIRFGPRSNILTIFVSWGQPKRPADNAIITIGEVADYLKATERTIYRLAGAKQIPAFKVGGSWRFSKVDLDKWIQQQSTQTDKKMTKATEIES
jgi:excisionase family DNA binding protein